MRERINGRKFRDKGVTKKNNKTTHCYADY
jgi:hypothetical protein